MHPKYKYVFIFKKKRFGSLDLLGKSIEDFWNDIYDLFALEGGMLVERLDGKEFTVRQIKKLFGDLLENMMDNFAVIDLNIINPRRIKFINCGDSHLEFLLEKNGDEVENFDAEGLTKDLSYNLLKDEIEGLKRLKLQKLVEDFSISTPELLNKRKFSGIRYCLENFHKAREYKKNSFFYFYNIIEKVKGSGSYAKILNSSSLTRRKVDGVTKILNDPLIKGSRHEGKGIKTRRATKQENDNCELTVKRLIDGWIGLHPL